MILANAPDSAGERQDETRARAFWAGVAVERTVFCTLWTTGPDPAIDGVVRLQAERPGSAPGVWETFDRACDPFTEQVEPPDASVAVPRSADPRAASTERARPIAEVWTAFREFIGAGPLIASQIDALDPWLAHLAGTDRDLPLSLGVREFASLLFPGRAATRDEVAHATFVVPPLTASPAALRAAVREVVRRVLDESADRHALAVAGYARAWNGLASSAPRAAERLRFALALVDRPSAWSIDGSVDGSAPADGRLREHVDAHESLDDLLEIVRPRCAIDGERWSSIDTVAVERDEVSLFETEDRAIVDDVFETQLPAQFASESGASAASCYRAGQHDVARQVAATLGARELLLVHAPTGTGKTLAYLVPAMLWSARHDLRVGIATYTRTLQDQAMDRELPRARAALRAAGCAIDVRVSLLKGRENYVCWRALKQALPVATDPGELWLAWTMLVLFAATDPEGDLDRLPQRAGLPLESSTELQAVLRTLLRDVRAHSGCCTQLEDRETCAADLARKRAERSHVVITNQTLALLRPELFKHLVFDECEHLHDQALSAFSHDLTVASVRGLFARLHHSERRRSRAVLDRLHKMVIAGSPTEVVASRALEALRALSSALTRLERAVGVFEEWRETELQQRTDRDSHSLLREYAARDDAAELVDSRRAFTEHGNELDRALADIAERLDQVALRGVAGVRRGLDLARVELASVLEAIEAWFPLDEGQPSFRTNTFYDVERDARGELTLVARVLLPHEHLGSQYYPQLSTGVFLSATAWLQESFQPALGYLGLDRAAHPAEYEDRLPSIVRTARAPEVFDYSRVVVAVPRDAPAVTADKAAFLAYVRRFLAFLGERTRGRMLVLFTNSQDVRQVGAELSGFFRARRIPLWFQNMEGASKEELGELFRSRVDSVLLGVDTFWYGADFPGETLEYLVIVKLPYGVPDRYHHAQCAALGAVEQRNRIYLPRAIAKFRQGFGRLMRRVSDRGCVFLLDGRVLDPRHRHFLRELPLENALERDVGGRAALGRSRLVRGDTARCVYEALLHMNLVDEVQRRGLDFEFDGSSPEPRTREDDVIPRPAAASDAKRTPLAPTPRVDPIPPDDRLDIPLRDVPF